MAYALSGGAVSAGMFAYITGSPFVFIELYKVPTQHYGWIFGVNALGMMLAAQVNRRMLATRSILTLLRAVTWASAAAGVAVWLGVAYSHTLWGVMLPLFVFLALLGFVFPNSAAGALGHQPCQRAGTAAAMHGVLQWAVAFVASLAVSQLHDGTARPMAGVVAVAGLTSLVLFRVMLPADEH
ncbi:MAG: hypothetical protein EOO40_08565 [Deltaproteobacteria bacterium]|nr:MAG: hypothetical protein EOO40_08565 [Deltaproteobacteria bacterium]